MNDTTISPYVIPGIKKVLNKKEKARYILEVAKKVFGDHVFLDKNLVRADADSKHVAIYLMTRDMQPKDYSFVANLLGLDRTLIYHAKNKIEGLSKYDDIRDKINLLETNFKNYLK